MPLLPTVAVPCSADATLVQALADQGDVQVLVLADGAGPGCVGSVSLPVAPPGPASPAEVPAPDLAPLRFARSLGAHYLLRMRAGPAGAPTLLLVETRGGQRLWVRRWDRASSALAAWDAPWPRGDAADLGLRGTPGPPQDATHEAGALAHAIASAMLRHEAARATGQPPGGLETAALLAGGIVGLHAPGLAAHGRALALLEQLAVRHPRHPAAPAWRAHARVLQVQQGWSADARLHAPEALALARQAVALAPGWPVALAVEGWVQGQLAQAPGPALARGMEAVAAGPDWALAWTWLGLAYAQHGDAPRAAAAVLHGLQRPLLAPLHPLRDASTAAALVLAGRWREAASLARRALRGHGHGVVAWEALVQAQWHMGRRMAARATARQLLQRAPGATSARYLERTPAPQALARPLAQALEAAGLPAG